MATTERGKGRGLISHIFQKNGIIVSGAHEPPRYLQPKSDKLRHNRSASASAPKNSRFLTDDSFTMKPHSRYKYNEYPKHKQTSSAYSMNLKQIVFNDEDDDLDLDIHSVDDLPQFSPPLKLKNRSSLTLEQNPLATSPNISLTLDVPNINPSAAPSVDLDLLQQIDNETEKININMSPSAESEEEEQSSSYSYDAIGDDDEYVAPPGYTVRHLSAKRKNTRGSCIDNDEKYKRRKSNRKDVWRRMMTSIMDGAATFGANALQLLSEFEFDEEEDDDMFEYEHKYNNGVNPRKYESVTKNNSLFRHNGYTIKRRLSSHESLRSRYTAKCYRRKTRPRSKSDPCWLPFTKRFDRKLELEYRPGVMNIFQMDSKKKKTTFQPIYPTRAHQDSIYFRYVFDDSDFEEDSIEEFTGDLLDTYNMEIPAMDPVDVKNDTNDVLSNGKHIAPHKITNRKSFSSLNLIKGYGQSLPQHIGKGMARIKYASAAPKAKQPLVPYGGHIEASERMIEDEFGSNIKHINVYSVKKRNKFGRDIDRIAVLDVPLQVLRIKDKKHKTHKEHIVSSISGTSININDGVGDTQIIIQFHDNRDYFLSFGSHTERDEFRHLIEKLRVFNENILAKRPNNSRDNRAQTVIRAATPNEDESNFGFYDDDDEISMSQSYSTAINFQSKYLSTKHINGQPQIPLNRQRFDTEMFDNLTDDGNVYTGIQTANVVYRIIKINKWGTKKERTMIVHKSDRIVRLFDDKRRCHSEYSLKIMATLDIIDSLNVEVVFLIDQKPTQFVFRSHVDLWDFVEQIRTLAPNEIMVSDRRKGKNKKKATMLPPQRNERIRGVSQVDINLNVDIDQDEINFDDEIDINPNVLRFSVLRLIKSQARMNQQVTWRQHRRCLYLDLEKRVVRMLTLGMHIKDYRFEDILLLEKSYINVNQLHTSCRHKEKIKDYWYEFISPQARAEFVGRLLGALPGTQQVQQTITQNPLYLNSSNNNSNNSNDTNIITMQNLSPTRSATQTPPNINSEDHNGSIIRAKRKPRRKRLSSDSLRALMQEDNHKFNKSIASSPHLSSANSSDEGFSEDEDVHNMNLNFRSRSPSLNMNTATGTFTEDPLSIIVGSWNVSESEINFANLKMWIPPSKIEPHDIYIIGLQECAASLRKQWVSGILRHIDSGRKEYVLLNKAWLMGIGLIIIVHRSHITKISHLHAQVVPTGKGNIIGNKGATAISFQFQETSFAFINAHLAARAEKFEKRAKNFNRIIKNLELGRPGLDVLHQFTHTFFLGDLNYRIERDFYETVEMVKKKKWSQLIKTDQLSAQMSENHVFYGFREGEINFCPTYRWERNKNTISNKREQPPSYCDRILYRSLPQTYDLWQECYLSSHRCFGSDHRPVWSIFKFKPKMPYFTSAAHQDCDDRDHAAAGNNDKNNEYKNISISLVELQASFKGGALNNKKKILIHLDDVIDIILHYNYASKPIRLAGGTYDKASRCWRWPINILDALRIKPFISDPHFICRTHIFVCFLNVSKGNLCIGYSIISLFNAFPKSLIDTKKVMKQFKSVAKQMHLMPSPYNVDVGHGYGQNTNTQFGNKQFDIPILLYGNPLGNLTGFVYADGKIVEKHRKITNLDQMSAYAKNMNSNKHLLTQSKRSLFKRASRRIIDLQHSFQ